MDERAIMNLIYSMLVANCPVDTRNMQINITLEEGANYFKINISGPSKYGDYAEAVNYNRQRGPKEIRNYKWVERTLRQVAEIIGGNVQYELS